MHSRFNSLAIEFLERMEASFPEEDRIRYYRANYVALQKINSMKPVELFMENMREYGAQILTRDEHFFMKEENVESAQRISGQIGLVDHWNQMPQSVKAAVWEYMQGLYMLGMGALGLHEELQALMDKTGIKT